MNLRVQSVFSRQPMGNRRIVILTEGYTNPSRAKTAAGVLRYAGDDVVAVLDSAEAGQTAQALLNAGGDTPIVASVKEVTQANTLMIGVAPTGGKLPPPMRRHVLEAIQYGWTIESGLHDFLCEDEEFAAAARESGAVLKDFRKNSERDVAMRQGLRAECLRLHTVGHDCSVGKMATAIELARGLSAANVDAKFVATGQTGMMIEGGGLPIDAVVGDFISGAAEKLVLENQHHEAVVVEGQGSITHPCYAAVTLGLLHGCAPHGVVYCYEMGRTNIHGLEHVALPTLADSIELVLANAVPPCQLIGIAINGRNASDAEYAKEKERMAGVHGVPAVDVYREGAGDLVKAALALMEAGCGTAA